ncbi:glycosyltransferase family 4 protein [Asticcacaulis benevestitus]|uniref:Glycosyl transferase family 1 domain-containing protein n=1 Tax=Asticcacaulis benevestitus DSM 16100 = ATCC BAA-896 TaxID=1121022 RepID=V4PB95_9CAUL|nr:glycosyltransferase family 1 protein [Asticcacaulis benevestitus]ESQ91132.1 hypothetical protein ABENE_10770 [Asticcacaulis benevestitus DSM 16100 = ATCC BAA-896]
MTLMNTNSKRIRVLQDLSMGMLGFSGIPQDTRLMFKTLSHMPDIEVTGLLSEMGPGYTDNISTRISTNKQFNILQGSLFLLAASGVELNNRRRLPSSLGRFIKLYRLLTRKYAIAPLDFDALDDSIWRLFFQKTLEAEDRDLILKQQFALTNLNFTSFTNRLRLPFFRAPRLSTEGYDFLITSEPRPIAVSAGTRHIARCHDIIPLTDPDMFDEFSVTKTAFRMIQKSGPKSIYCCVSKPSEEQLLRVFPDLKGRTITIPNALPTLIPERSIPIREIIKIRKSDALAGPHVSIGDDFSYILAVCTLEPRKNISNLVRAWERVRNEAFPNIKLIIVGRPGWKYESTLSAMRPGIAAGNIIHLQDVPSPELRSLYKNARCFVFPSFSEGFGFPPMEAIQCGTPAIVSDIAAHRWVMGEAATYVDPYDVDDIAGKIMKLLLTQQSDLPGEVFNAHTRFTLDRYSVDQISGQWAELFGRLKHDEFLRSD